MSLKEWPHKRAASSIDFRNGLGARGRLHVDARALEKWKERKSGNLIGSASPFPGLITGKIFVLCASIEAGAV